MTLWDTDLLQQKRMIVENYDRFPTKTYLETEISTILKYYQSAGVEVDIVDTDNIVITVHELVNKYYNDADQYFELSKKEKDRLQLIALAVLHPHYPIRQPNNDLVDDSMP